ncbi:MAG TPA: FAD-dependent oxidoreductase [Thermoanaerobaculia bacterium]|jgi:glycine/D-amino acid oxidase-like deaminating enzyme|nr:FAD-dependent oxidoreductase [Thermoanaerobaculia bacterium]
MSSLPHVAVVGAGAFGGWTALRLRERGCRVTLIDAWGPGNARASSGGETRILRGIYGPDRIYVQWVVRSLAAWREAERRWNVPLYHPTGALWLCGPGDTYVRPALPSLKEAGLTVNEIGLDEARRRFPEAGFEGISSVFFEETAGYLMARRACRAVAEAAGGFRQATVSIQGERVLMDGSILEADAFVFACGPWLNTLFPDVAVRPTRQEVFFFGTPAGWRDLPVWIESGERFFYGIPGNDHRGFKVADDTRGEPFDPTSGERAVSPEGLERVRRHLALRFPALASAPLLESRVCQYENSPDGHLLIDRHLGLPNAWIVGGGSGHGFKLGPAVGDHAAALVLGEAEPLPLFRLDRPVVLKTQFTSGGLE